MRTLRLAPVLLLLVLSSPAPAGEEECTVRRGAWFEVVCHFEHDRAVNDALAAGGADPQRRAA